MSQEEGQSLQSTRNLPTNHPLARVHNRHRQEDKGGGIDTKKNTEPDELLEHFQKSGNADVELGSNVVKECHFETTSEVVPGFNVSDYDVLPVEAESRDLYTSKMATCNNVVRDDPLLLQPNAKSPTRSPDLITQSHNTEVPVTFEIAHHRNDCTSSQEFPFNSYSVVHEIGKLSATLLKPDTVTKINGLEDVNVTPEMVVPDVSECRNSEGNVATTILCTGPNNQITEAATVESLNSVLVDTVEPSPALSDETRTEMWHPLALTETPDDEEVIHINLPSQKIAQHKPVSTVLCASGSIVPKHIPKIITHQSSVPRHVTRFNISKSMAQQGSTSTTVAVPGSSDPAKQINAQNTRAIHLRMKGDNAGENSPPPSYYDCMDQTFTMEFKVHKNPLQTSPKLSSCYPSSQDPLTSRASAPTFAQRSKYDSLDHNGYSSHQNSYSRILDQDVHPQESSRSEYSPQAIGNNGILDTDHQLLSFIACLFCWPIGLVAIYYSNMSQILRTQGNYTQAQAYAKQAFIIATIGMCAGSIMYIIVFVCEKLL